MSKSSTFSRLSVNLLLTILFAGALSFILACLYDGASHQMVISLGVSLASLVFFLLIQDGDSGSVVMADRPEERPAKDRYDIVSDMSSDGIFVLKVTGGRSLALDWATPGLERITGYSVGKMKERNFGWNDLARFLHEKDRNVFESCIMDLWSGREMSAPFRVFHVKNGALQWVHIKAVPVLDGREKIIEIRGALRDITEQKRVEDVLRESERRFTLFMDYLPAAGFIKDEKNRILYANKYMKEHFRVQDWIDRDISESLDEDRKRRIVESDRKALAEGKSLHLESVVAEGGRREFYQVHKFLMDRGNRPSLIGGIALDITEQKKTELKLFRSYDQIRKAMEGTIDMVVKIVELRDPYTAGHQEGVARLAVSIAEDMKLSDEQIETVRTSALVHDLGKVNVPTEILTKPGKLTAIEFGLVKNHPRAGYDILKKVQFPWPVARVVLQHHERLDGSGYPEGIGGDDVLLEARILAVADVVEAMSAYRPYRPGLGLNKALEEIARGRGRLYDPDVVDACLRVCARNGGDLMLHDASA